MAAAGEVARSLAYPHPLSRRRMASRTSVWSSTTRTRRVLTASACMSGRLQEWGLRGGLRFSRGLARRRARAVFGGGHTCCAGGHWGGGADGYCQIAVPPGGTERAPESIFVFGEAGTI